MSFIAVLWVAIATGYAIDLYRADGGPYHDRARLVGHGSDRLTRPRDDEMDAIAVPVEGEGYRYLLLPDGPNYPETIGAAIGRRSQ